MRVRICRAGLSSVEMALNLSRFMSWRSLTPLSLACCQTSAGACGAPNVRNAARRTDAPCNLPARTCLSTNWPVLRGSFVSRRCQTCRSFCSQEPSQKARLFLQTVDNVTAETRTQRNNKRSFPEFLAWPLMLWLTGFALLMPPGSVLLVQLLLLRRAPCRLSETRRHA